MLCKHIERSIERILNQCIIPLTLTRPVPCPIKPSDVHKTSYNDMHSPIFWTTCTERWVLAAAAFPAIQTCSANTDLVCVFRINVILYCYDAVLWKVFWRDLHQIGKFGLWLWGLVMLYGLRAHRSRLAATYQDKHCSRFSQKLNRLLSSVS